MLLHILGLQLGVFGGLITPVCSYTLSERQEFPLTLFHNNFHFSPAVSMHRAWVLSGSNRTFAQSLCGLLHTQTHLGQYQIASGNTL